MKNLNDIQLVEIFESQRNATLEEIYNRYSDLVYGVCLKYLGNRDESLDAVIEVFEQLLVKIPAHTISNFSSWLYSLTKNHCLMKIRKDKRKQKALQDLYAKQGKVVHEVDSIEETIPVKKIEEALCQLPSEQKVCIVMFYYQSKSYSEISGVTGFPEKAVKSYLQNGRVKLKKIMEEK